MWIVQASSLQQSRVLPLDAHLGSVETGTKLLHAEVDDRNEAEASPKQGKRDDFNGHYRRVI